MSRSIEVFPLLACACLAVWLTGCSKADDAESASAATPAASSSNAKAETPQATNASFVTQEEEPKDPMPRKVIYTGEVSLVCEDLDKATTKLENEIRDMGGYIGNANSTGNRGETRQGSWTIRIPSERFDPFLKFLQTLGELQESSRKADDVSEEYYDAEARMTNKRVEEERLQDLLKRASGHLADVLTLEKELSRVREEIERIQGRLKYLANQTAMSTLTVTMREVKGYAPEGPPTLGTRVGRSFGGSMDALKDFGVGALLLAVAVAPWLLPLGLLAWLVHRILRRKKLTAS